MGESLEKQTVEFLEELWEELHSWCSSRRSPRGILGGTLRKTPTGNSIGNPRKIPKEILGVIPEGTAADGIASETAKGIPTKATGESSSLLYTSQTHIFLEFPAFS